MKRITTLSIFTFLLVLSLGSLSLEASNSFPIDSLAEKERIPPGPIYQARRSFSFGINDKPSTAPVLPPDEDNLVPGLVEMEQAAASSEQLINARRQVRNALDAGRFIQRLDSLSWIEFPVVLTDTISNVPINIVFDYLRLYPEYAELSVVVQMQLPQKKVAAMAGVNSPPTGPAGDGSTTEYVELFFGTPSLRFSHDGGIIGDANIRLFSDTPIGMANPDKFAFVLKRMQSQGTAGNNTGTFVTIDCDGFVEMGIDADVYFSRNWIVPVDANDKPIGGRVRGNISTVVNDWQNILVELDLPNFAPADYTEVAMNLSRAVFDFSDFRNSPSVVFPPAYAEQNLLPSSPSLWRGVYIQNIELSLPRQIKDKNCQETTTLPSGTGTGMLMLDETGAYAYEQTTELTLPDNPYTLAVLNLPEFIPPLAGASTDLELAPPITTTVQNCRIKMGAEHLLIDGHGVSGYFYGENVLPLELGKADKWRFSITNLAFELTASKVVAFGFGGELGVPICKKEQNFEYDAFYNIPDRSLNMLFISQQDYEFPIFKMADAQILAGSYLDITITPDKFEPVAVLYGFAAVRGKVSSESEDGDDSQEEESALSFSAPRIDFQGLRLATKGPVISLVESQGFLAVSVGVKVLGYEVPLPNPTLTILPGGRTQLSFNIQFNLMKPEDNGFAAEADVDFKGELKEEDRVHYWASAGMSIGHLEVNIKLEALEVYGYVHIFEDHPVFGKGFQGSLMVNVGKYQAPNDPLMSLELNAIFGKTTFRYWYVDGFLELDNLGIKLLPTPLEINGFGGGAYYRMRMSGADLDGGSDGSLGTMTSGVSYVPDEDTVLGLKASLALRTTGTDCFDGLVTLELRFVQTGLQEIAFYGKGEFIPPNGIASGEGFTKFSDKLRDRLTDIPLSREASQAKDSLDVDAPYDRILATVFMQMNFERGFEFQGTFRVFISAAGGTLVGQGGVDILISQPLNRWHFYIGGYTDNSIIASDRDTLPPISIQMNLGEGIEAGADVYFLTGNDIPGPPPIHPAAADYFNITETPTENRDQLGGQAAQGTGFAFGAAAYANIDKRIGRKDKTRLVARVGVGFDVSLLKYQTGTYCSVSGNSPHGHKGWRATGSIWAFLEGRAERGLLDINLSIGVMIYADLPKPTYLLFAGVFKIGPFNVSFEESVGDQCGIPVVGSN